MLLERSPGTVAKALVIEVGARCADDTQTVGQQPVRIETVERGQEHPPRKVAGRAEHHEGRDPVGYHRAILLSPLRQRMKMVALLHSRLHARAIMIPSTAILAIIAAAGAA